MGDVKLGNRWCYFYDERELRRRYVPPNRRSRFDVWFGNLMTEGKPMDKTIVSDAKPRVKIG